MASHLAVRTSSLAIRQLQSLSFASRRCIRTSFQKSCDIRSSKHISLSHASFQQTFRRAYSDAPSASLSPDPKPRKRFRFLRWTWRLTYISAIGLVGWLSYTVWELRNPNDQFDPDPSKKTLVILGEPSVDKKRAAFANNWKVRAGARYLY